MENGWLSLFTITLNVKKSVNWVKFNKVTEINFEAVAVCMLIGKVGFDPYIVMSYSKDTRFQGR